MSTKKYYTIQLTNGSTSPGLYTIYYGAVPNPPLFTGSIVPPVYPIAEPPVLAQNLGLSALTGNGIIVEVPKSTTVLYLYNQTCPENTITLIPTNSIVYKDFCLTFTNYSEKPPTVTAYHFTQNGFDSNGNPIWISDSDSGITVKWDEHNWVVLGYNPLNATIKSSSYVTANPPEGWSTDGISSRVLTVDYNINGCSSSERKASFPVSINQPTCLCDGSILFNPNLDNPPFTYSIDNGVTYSSSPIFSNLCSGIYNLSILDSLDNNITKTITLDRPTLAITYTLSLNTISNTQINNPTTISRTYNTTVIVTPELPDGTSLYFDIIHNNSFYSGPLSGSSILTTGTLLYKNEVSVPLSSTFSGDSTSVNTSPGCQSNTIYQLNTTDSWSSLELTNTDTITISTSTRTDKTTLGLCVVGYSNDSYSIANARIVGCDCCTILINT